MKTQMSDEQINELLDPSTDVTELPWVNADHSACTHPSIDDEEHGICRVMSDADYEYALKCVDTIKPLLAARDQLQAKYDRLVESARAVVAPSPLGPKVTWLEDGSPKIDAHDSCVQFSKDWAALEAALKALEER